MRSPASLTLFRLIFFSTSIMKRKVRDFFFLTLSQATALIVIHPGPLRGAKTKGYSLNIFQILKILLFSVYCFFLITHLWIHSWGVLFFFLSENKSYLQGVTTVNNFVWIFADPFPGIYVFIHTYTQNS